MIGDRRGPGMVLAGLIVLLVTTACSPDRRPDDGVAASPAATDHCAAPALQQVQFGSHLLGDTAPPVPYSSTPPTSGWHASGAIPVGATDPDDPLTEPEQVSVLEVGAVVISYNDLAAEDVASLTDIVHDRFPGRTSLTTYPDIPRGSIALTAWGILQTCDQLDVAAVDAFISAYAVEDPDIPGTDQTPRTNKA